MPGSQEGGGEGNESLVATVCACADFSAVNHHARAMLVIKYHGIIRLINMVSTTRVFRLYIVNSNRSVLILGNTTGMKKQWVIILEQLVFRLVDTKFANGA